MIYKEYCSKEMESIYLSDKTKKEDMVIVRKYICANRIISHPSEGHTAAAVAAAVVLKEEIGG